jgi:N-acetylneuraminic acid mutarotase
MKGDSTKNVIRTYGARGVPAETNTPGGRSQIQSWKDAYGKLWLFGGFGVDSILSFGGTTVRPLNDLWKYDPLNNQWTWMAGDSAKNSLGSYGAKGTAATTNTPKPRHYYNLILTDTLADVWLFGGMEGVHPLNDLWTYNSSLNQWAWLNGDSLGVIPATYGTRGIPAAANKPGPRQESVSWTDTSSNLWLFGGYGNPTGKVGAFNDLWKYESTNGQWTWVKGDSIEDVSTSYANYGSDSTYRPSARAASASWKDLSGNLWLYGGSGWAGFRFGHLNDLWKYNITTNNWTWINGGTYFYSAPVYGTKGIAAADNQPGGRSESVSYTDASGNLWLFGGRSYTGGGQTTYFNDFWKYDPSSNLWTWISGNNTANVEGTYGTLVIPDALNNPGSRSSSASWTDTTGNFWLFGGVGYDANGKYGSLNDLWKYTVSTNEWTWMNGDNTANFAGTYGTQGTTAAANKPGSRYNSAGWKDALNNLWLFGGTGFAVTDSGALNDLWKYNISTNQWTWVKGDNTINVAGSYSMPGTSVEANKPGARSSSVSWTDASGKFWLFGGRGLFVNAEGILNDLWNISSMDLLPIKLLSFSGKIINKDVSLSWQTTEEINTGYYNIQRSLNGAEFETIGKVNAFFFNSGMNDHLFTDVKAFATNSATLFYRLEIINKDNSKTYSNIIKLNLFNAKQSIVISPNPSFSTMTISISNNKTEAATLIICDMKGVIIRKENISLINGTMSKDINVSMLKSGAYIATLMSSQKQQKKFIKQ